MYTIQKIYDTMISKDYEKVLKMPKEELQEQAVLEAGKTRKEASIIKDLIKEAPEDLKGYQQYNDKYAFISNHRFYVSNSDFGYEEAKRKVNFKGMMEIECDASVSVDIVGLKTHIKTSRKVPYRVAETEKGGIWVNPIYLLDALDFCKSTEIQYIKSEFKDGSYRSPIIIKGDVNFALVLPVAL